MPFVVRAHAAMLYPLGVYGKRCAESITTPLCERAPRCATRYLVNTPILGRLPARPGMALLPRRLWPGVLPPGRETPVDHRWGRGPARLINVHEELAGGLDADPRCSSKPARGKPSSMTPTSLATVAAHQHPPPPEPPPSRLDSKHRETSDCAPWSKSQAKLNIANSEYRHPEHRPPEHPDNNSGHK